MGLWGRWVAQLTAADGAGSNRPAPFARSLARRTLADLVRKVPPALSGEQGCRPPTLSWARTTQPPLPPELKLLTWYMQTTDRPSPK